LAEERRLVTVLFADVTGSTALGEALDPEALRGLLARYFTIARTVVESYGGTVEKFIGDAVMAVFGLPLAHGDDVARALDAALELRDRVRADPALGERLPIRLGVNTGEVVASRDASAGDFLVTGDAVNVAARLQQAAEPWSILVGERAVSAAPDGFDFGSSDGVVAKGKALPVAARELQGRVQAHRVEHTPFVGRAQDLAELDLLAGRAFTERRPFLVSIIAPPGVGKSRLLEEFEARLRVTTPEVALAVAQCLPYGQRLTYWPLRALLLELLELPAETSSEQLRRDVERWLADAGDERPERTAELLAATVGAAEAELVDRAALFAAWRSTVELAAARRPLLLVVEDLHWSSDSLLDLVEFILQPRADVPLLMVALARPELLDRRPTWGGGRRNVVSLALEPLGDDEVAELVGDLLDGPAPEIVRNVVERADGNPFYAGEIVRSVIERCPDLRDSGAVESCLAALPDSVQATILARLDMLPAAARRQLQVGSVFGRVYPTAGVAALDRETGASDIDAADALIERELVRPAGRGAFAFRHILIREVAYGTMTRAERIALHEGAGAWLESTAGSDAEALAELIAHHYREAISLARTIGQPVADASRRRAVAWLSRAASVAAAGAANQEAARHLRAAIELADPAEQPDLYLRLGQTQLGGDEGIGAFARAYELGRELGRSPDFLLLALALRLTAMTRWFASVARQPTLDEFDRLTAEARELLEVASDEHARAVFYVSEAFVPFWLANLGRSASPAVLAHAEESARRGLEIAERLGDVQLLSAALDGLGGVMSSEGHHRAAVDIARRRLEFEEQLVLQERLDAFNVVAWQASVVGELDEAIAAAERGLAAVQPGQDPYFALAVANWRPYALTLLGRWDEVRAATERCRQLWIEGGRGTSGYALSGFIAGLYVARERQDDAAIESWSSVIDAIVGQFEAGHPTRRLMAFVGPDLPALAADVAGHPEVYRERLHHVERAFAACADRGEPIELGAIDRVVAIGTERGTRPLLAQALRARGLQRRDEADLRQALALFDEIRARPYVARVRTELGELSGDQPLFREGLADLDALGDLDQLARVRQRTA
jgi:class 3 adenylate cyclase/tetratricopeptide (TPR) repeat protein